MRSNVFFIVALFVIALSSCNQASETALQKETQPAVAESIFPKGELIDTTHFSGGSGYVYWIHRLDSTFNTQVASVNYEKGARTRWHNHPAGQMLLIISGTAYYQERGKPKQILSKGDVAKCLPNINHWHGASPESPVTLIAVNPNIDKGGVQWLEAVTDEVYNR